MTPPPIPPGSTIGILGAGQLGRMLALAAAELGYRVAVLTPEEDAPAAQVAALTIQADYEDEAALMRLAQVSDVVTLEFENVPAAAVEFLESFGKPVRPGSRVLAVAQDRVAEKDFVRATGGGTAPYEPIGHLTALIPALNRIGRPAILKTRRMGYDGKGQRTIRHGDNPVEAWDAIGGKPAILEGFVNFTREISVIVARGVDGTTRSYVPVENRHRAHILAETIAPAPISRGLAEQAEALAARLAHACDLVGLLAVEMFVTDDGRILVNELAPRPHNSGHWTIDACLVSQFEQTVRAVCGLPLGSPERHSDAEMINLLGSDIDHWMECLGEPATRLHLYGKAEARPGRKMGHVTRISPRADRR
ncbi:MAG: 5-(carboxyamino)imidazole ribonucleotide synthase [Rhodospirillaceae bacterium]|nr:5-(carboxyamino)imidazole ribonucleotide synthase [Rhodospirillaceae bacterium]